MRALLLAAALALPALAGAQVADGVLQPVVGDEFVNAAQCKGADTAPVSLVWNTHVTTLFSTGGTYRLFASNTQPDSSGTNLNYCPETDNAANGVRAAQVG
ncbi:MAG TPA: fibronectin type III domain-containing protein, partial [Anaeromyxobacteraceae bacterium]|nr:fibronectin type III domain-containing protein [Anaeromyxobacteraceae bacterium]